MTTNDQTAVRGRWDCCCCWAEGAELEVVLDDEGEEDEEESELPAAAAAAHEAFARAAEAVVAPMVRARVFSFICAF